jgi:methionyl-tRNA formyltransferase
MNKDLRIIFLGTPEFAVASLQILVENGWDIVAVITAPDKPQGRGKQLGTSAVKDYALSVGLPVLQPINLKSEAFLDELKSYNANLQIVVAFRMLPVVVWDMPELGTFNLHGSLLPQYRGAAPINWAIINGEKETGVTTFFLKHEIDTGKIIFQEKEPIYPTDNVGLLYARLMMKGAELVKKTVAAIAKDNYPQTEQDQSVALKHAPKIFKPDCEINWNQSATKVFDFVRGLTPIPGAWCVLNGKNYKIHEVAPYQNQLNKEPGTVLIKEGKILVATIDGSIEIKVLQQEGKKKMDSVGFLNGNTI